MSVPGTTLPVRLGVTASSLIVHIESGGIEPRRALCGAKLWRVSDEPGEVTCTRCAEKAAAYGDRNMSDDGRDRINELYEIIYLALPYSEPLALAALDELRDTALTMHAALLREAVTPHNETEA
jgi:hypothetical protein